MRTAKVRQEKGLNAHIKMFPNESNKATKNTESVKEHCHTLIPCKWSRANAQFEQQREKCVTHSFKQNPLM